MTPPREFAKLDITVASEGWRSEVHIDGKLAPVVRWRVESDAHGETMVHLDLVGLTKAEPWHITGYFVDQAAFESHARLRDVIARFVGKHRRSDVYSDEAMATILEELTAQLDQTPDVQARHAAIDQSSPRAWDMLNVPAS